jgi:glycosyltransferase involved in cell wall biosynthesis
MQRKKILHIVTRLEKGGALSNILSLAEGLAAGYELVLALGELDSEKELVLASGAKAGYRVVWLPELVREISLLKDFRAFLDILDLLLKESPYVLHTHTSKAGFLGRLAAGLTGFKQVIHTPHGHVYYGYFGAIKSGFVVLLERFAALFTKSYIVFSEAEREDNLKRKIGKSRQFEIIPNGIAEAPYETAVSAERKKEELGLPKDKKIIGYAGRFAPVKGADIFIEALTLLSKKRSDFIGVLAGSGAKPEEDRIRELSRELEKQGLISFIGFRRDLPEVLKVFDVFVLPSRNEGSPLAVLEAQFAGVPVVVSAVGSLTAIIVAGETGILVPPGQAAPFAAAIDAVLNEPKLAARLREQAKKRARENYNYKKMLIAVKELYERP